MDRVLELLQAEAYAIYLVDGRSSNLSGFMCSDNASFPFDGHVPAGGIAGWVLETGTDIRLVSPWADDRYDPSVDVQLETPTHSMACAPLYALGRDSDTGRLTRTAPSAP